MHALSYRAVVGAVTLASTPQINKGPLLRDTIFYIISIITLFVFYWDGCITIVEAVMFPVFYIFYVTVVVVTQLKCTRDRMARIECICDKTRLKADTIESTELTTSLLNSSHRSINGDSTVEEPRKRKATMSDFFNFEDEGNYMKEIVHRKRQFYHTDPRLETLRQVNSIRETSVSMDVVTMSNALDNELSVQNQNKVSENGGAKDISPRRMAKSFSAGALSSHLNNFDNLQPGITNLYFIVGFDIYFRKT